MSDPSTANTDQNSFTQPAWRNALAGLQMLFVAFGALVLMPLITGLDPSVALFTAGIGTILFQFITKHQVLSCFNLLLNIRCLSFWHRRLYLSLPSLIQCKLGAWPPPWAHCLSLV